MQPFWCRSDRSVRAVGALGHYLESELIPTTQISLIREHTEVIRPPRALWVPFELSRPLGVPENPAFQRRVLLRTLELASSAGGFGRKQPRPEC